MQLMVALSKNEQFSKKLNKLLNAMDAPPMNGGRARWFNDYVKQTLKINVSYEATRKWLSGESMPYTKRIGSIAKGLNSTTEYLIGEQTENTNFENQSTGVNEERASYSMDDVNILNKINQLSKADRARLSGIIDALNTNMDKKAS